MSKYVSVRSNWISVDSVPLDSVCDVGFESEDRSQVNSEPIDTNDDTEIHRLVYCYFSFNEKFRKQLFFSILL